MKNGKQEKQGGVRPEWKARQTRKGIFGVLKVFAFVMVLGVVVGLGIAHRDQIMAMFKKEDAAPPPPPKKEVVVAPPVPTIAPPPPPMDVAKPAPPPPVDVPKTAVVAAIPSGEEDAAAKLIDQGKLSLENFQFDKAKAVFAQAAGKKAGPLIAQAKVWEKKADAFAAATNHIAISDYAAADVSYVIETVDGTEVRGLKVSEDSDKIQFQRIPPENPASTGRTTYPIDKSEVKNMVAFSKDQRRKEFVQLLDQLHSSVAIQRSADYYDLVYLSKRLGLGHECIDFMNAAFDGGDGHAADPFLGDTFRKVVIQREIDRASLMLAGGRPKALVEGVLNGLLKTLPNYEVAKDEVEVFRTTIMAKVKDNFKSTLTLNVKKAEVAVAKPVSHQAAPTAPTQSARQMTEEQVEVVVDNSGVHGNGAAAGICEQANAKYDEGMKFYRGFKQGSNGNNNQNLRAALKCLDEAIDLYDQALKKDPGNKSMESRQTEASMVAYGCRKYQTL
jgi:tetratricopeptide (TPR) repeat protein